MGPAEASDDSSDRFFASFGMQPGPVQRMRRIIATSAQPLMNLTPAARAVGLCLVIGWGLVVYADAIRTLAEAESRLELLAEMAAHDIAGSNATSYGKALGSLASLRRGADLFVTRDDGEVLASTAGALRSGSLLYPGQLEESQVVVQRQISGKNGWLVASESRSAILTPVWQRAGIALGIALLLGTLALRRSPLAGRRRDRDTLIGFMEDLPFGLAFWSGDAQLLTQNAQCRTMMQRAGCTKKAGSYHDFRQALAGRGELAVLSDDSRGRLSIYRPTGGTPIFIEERPLPGGGFVTLVAESHEGRVPNQGFQASTDQAALTEQLQIEIDKAKAASRTKTAFLAHLSHEIRTPLNHIIGFADLICHQSFGPVGDRRYSDYVQYIRQSGEKLLASFSEILELAELEGGKRQLQNEPITVADLIRQTKRRFAGQAERAGITLAVADAAEVHIQGDRHYLLLMLANIVDNALHYTPAGGVVILKAWAAEDGVVLEITDSGIGMSASRLETIGSDYVLGAGAFKREQGGAGLGIAIARSIAELSGGSLAIDSTPNLGTTVAIALPLKARRGANGAAA